MPTSVRPARFDAVLGTALGVVLLAAGCATTVPGPAAPTSSQQVPASPQSVAWADSVCGAILRFTDAVTAPPKLDASTPADAVRGVTGFLGTASTGLQGSIESLGQVGPSPVQGGDAVVQNLSATLTTVKTSFDAARSRLAAVNLNDPQALATALPEALTPLGQLARVTDLGAGLQANPELERAADQAPKCQQVRAGAH